MVSIMYVKIVTTQNNNYIPFKKIDEKVNFCLFLSSLQITQYKGPQRPGYYGIKKYFFNNSWGTETHQKDTTRWRLHPKFEL